ncbi:hypothetical protein SAMN06264855_12143 [Halorubrum vacuolatum]|uniref:Uncharacterized protein n=1 Tax=Halorubrum vacuolatum TaxID=63740 RepID=A0A238XRZ2_HALVU|nr:hypothetical protein SAMN06264855_12143 [Halorubrum vacuolatum]
MPQKTRLSKQELKRLNIKAKFGKNLQGQTDDKVILLLEHKHKFDREESGQVEGNMVVYPPESSEAIISTTEDIDQVMQECRNGNEYTELGNIISEILARRI